MSKEELLFYQWQQNQPYFGKKFSILGDSISTLEGYNPEGYNLFYTDENSATSHIHGIEDTWWGKVIGFLGGALLENNSWAGSRVTKLPENKGLFPSGCSDDRTNALHNKEAMPDVIMVYLGTNDWIFGAPLEGEAHGLDDDDNHYLEFAYNHMLQKLQKNYPNSEIWCCTLCETSIAENPDIKFSFEHAGADMEAYNNVIRNVVKKNKCKLIDLYRYHILHDTMEGLHPTNKGMSTMAKVILREVAGEDIDIFLDSIINSLRRIH